jgi:hypothetical protein
MRRSGRHYFLMGLLAAVLLAGGCGLNANRGPVVDGDAPRVPAEGKPNSRWVPPKGPEGVTSDSDLVKRFLEVAAQPRDARRTRIGEFFTDATRQQWYQAYDQLGQNDEITLVDVSYATQSKAGLLSVTLQPVGKLIDYGQVVPVPGGTKATWEVLIKQTRSGPRIDNLPSINGVLLTRSVFDAFDTRYFTPHTIYFWDKAEKSAQRVLVPDQRYMPNWVSAQVQPTEVVSWLINGPSDLISSVVRPLPSGTDLQGDGVSNKGTSVVVRLTSSAAREENPNDIAVQIKWSLLDWLTPSTTISIEAIPVDVRIEGIANPFRASADRFRAANALVGQREDGYALKKGEVVELGVNGETGGPVLELSNGTKLGSVQSAGVSQDGSVGALVVKRTKDGRMRLTVGGHIGDSKLDYQATPLIGRKMSRPTFLGRSNRLLVVCDGNLYTLQGSNPQRIDEVTAPGLPPLKSVESAPDGKRVVMVTASGAVLIATVDDNGILVMPNWSTLTTTDIGLGLTKLTVVAAGWSSGTEVFIAGESAGAQVFRRLSVDGIRRTTANTSQKIASVYGAAVRPPDPLNTRHELIMLIDAQVDTRSLLRVYSQDTQPYPDLSDGGTSSDDRQYTAPFFAG